MRGPSAGTSDLAGIDVEMCRTLVPRLLEVAPDAVLLMVTNPVDVLTFAALRFSDLPSRRVLGSGTVLDSSRLRDLLACQRRGRAERHAWIVGEHGDSEFPVWSTATVGSVPVARFSLAGRRPPVDDEAKARIAAEVVGAAERIIRGKGATNYAIGLAATRVIEAIIRDESRVLPVTSSHVGHYGLPDVCMSAPRVVNRGAGRRCWTCRCPPKSLTACTNPPSPCAWCRHRSAGEPRLNPGRCQVSAVHEAP